MPSISRSTQSLGVVIAPDNFCYSLFSDLLQWRHFSFADGDKWDPHQIVASRWRSRDPSQMVRLGPGWGCPPSAAAAPPLATVLLAAAPVAVVVLGSQYLHFLPIIA